MKFPSNPSTLLNVKKEPGTEPSPSPIPSSSTSKVSPIPSSQRLWTEVVSARPNRYHGSKSLGNMDTEDDSNFTSSSTDADSSDGEFVTISVKIKKSKTVRKTASIKVHISGLGLSASNKAFHKVPVATVDEPVVPVVDQTDNIHSLNTDLRRSSPAPVNKGFPEDVAKPHSIAKPKSQKAVDKSHLKKVKTQGAFHGRHQQARRVSYDRNKFPIEAHNRATGPPQQSFFKRSHSVEPNPSSQHYPVTRKVTRPPRYHAPHYSKKKCCAETRSNLSERGNARKIQGAFRRHRFNKALSDSEHQAPPTLRCQRS